MIVRIHAQIKSDSSHGDASEVLKKVKTHLLETFPQDFPFYLILAYRLHMIFPIYECEELKTFIPSCISQFEGMDPKNIARVMISFIDRYVYVHMMYTVTVLSRNYTSLVYKHPLHFWLKFLHRYFCLTCKPPHLSDWILESITQ